MDLKDLQKSFNETWKEMKGYLDQQTDEIRQLSDALELQQEVLETLIEERR
jgi:Mg2+ and Co2+ transporter CorA